jgi:hypothetical protein
MILAAGIQKQGSQCPEGSQRKEALQKSNGVKLTASKYQQIREWDSYTFKNASP